MITVLLIWYSSEICMACFSELAFDFKSLKLYKAFEICLICNPCIKMFVNSAFYNV